MTKTGNKLQRITFLILGLLLFIFSAVAREPANRPHPSFNMLEVERRLSNLGYWIIKVDGIADASTRHAINAFQKVQGLKRTGRLSDHDIDTLREAGRPTARFITGAAHIEVDINRQVLFLTDDAGVIVHILPVSTGNDKRYFDQGKWQIAHTPRGRFRIERKLRGVRKAPLGSLYNPNYFYSGTAIHGSGSVPTYPASHGCVRIPRFADKAFSDMAPIGMEVFVYD
jgi:lipoprotein-anchoring transpeptidase ErfK/SrfK